jgi:peptidoglycan/xylan/chitin deacetylase (PgdA/CDA1 family)
VAVRVFPPIARVPVRTWARIGIVAQFLALLRILAQYLWLEARGGEAFTAAVGHPWVVAGLLTAALALVAVLLYFVERFRAAAGVAGLTVAVLLVYRFVVPGVASAAPVGGGAPQGVPVTDATPRTGVGSRRVALTFDDLPWADADVPLDSVAGRTRRLLAVLRAHDAPAVAFVIGRRVLAGGHADRRLDLLRAWRDAGVELGNHTWSHLAFQKTPLDRYEDDVLRGDAVPRLLMGEVGKTPHFFRPPLNQTGPTREARDAFAAFLAERGYALAPFTVEDVDYAFDDLYRAAAGDTARQARIGRTYLAHFDTAMAFGERLSRETFGREIPQVLLLHADDLNALYLGRILDRLESRGYRFITLRTALADSAYATPDGYVGRWGISWLHRWRAGLGLPSRLRDEPDPPAWVLDDYRALHEKK